MDTKGMSGSVGGGFIGSISKVLAHRHRHSRASCDGETAFSRHANVSNVDFVHGLVQCCGRGVAFADPTFANHGEKVESGQVEQLDLTENDDTDFQ